MIRSEDTAPDAIEVKFLPFGGSSSSLVLPAGTTVEDALAQAGFEGYTPRVGGEIAEPGDILEDGDVVVLSGSTDKVKGGLIKVKGSCK